MVWPGYAVAVKARAGKRHVHALVVGGLTVLLCGWGSWFAVLAIFAEEGLTPPRWRIPEVPPGATVIEETKECASGGCWWRLVLKPAAGQTPDELAATMGVSESRVESPALLDPAFVGVGAETRDSRLVVHVGYE